MNTVSNAVNLNKLSVLQLQILRSAIEASDAGKVGIYPNGGPMHRAFQTLSRDGLLEFKGFSLINGEKVSIYAITDPGRQVFADASPLAYGAQEAPTSFAPPVGPFDAHEAAHDTVRPSEPFRKHPSGTMGRVVPQPTTAHPTVVKRRASG